MFCLKKITVFPALRSYQYQWVIWYLEVGFEAKDNSFGKGFSKFIIMLCFAGFSYKVYDIVLKVFKGATNYQIVVLAVLGGGSNNQRRSDSSCLILNTGMMRK